MQSLKRRITVSVIAIFIVSWLLSALVTSVTARVVLAREMDRILEGLLLVTETVGATFMTGELSQLQETFSDKMVPVPGSVGIQQGTPENPAVVRLHESLMLGPLGTPSINVWVGGIHLLVGEDTPVFARPDADMDVGDVRSQNIGGAPWRVMYRIDAEHQIAYAVGIKPGQAQFGAGELLTQMLLPLALIIPLTVLAMYYGVARGLRPLRLLAQQIEGRRQRGSMEPVEQADVPAEVEPVVRSLNHLLARLADTLENEKRFTANAAHELQTPLAAITTEVQLCQRLLADTESRDMIDRIYARVQRASHSVRQLLVLARLDPQAGLPMEAVDLYHLLQDVLSELGHIASERSLKIQFELTEQQLLEANREALMILLRNLVSNAFRYTPEGGTVRLTYENGELVIENDSPPVAEPGRLVERFYRGEQQAETGTGLGLSIVKRICELHGYSLSLAYQHGNGRFVVRLRCES